MDGCGVWERGEPSAAVAAATVVAVVIRGFIEEGRLVKVLCLGANEILNKKTK